MVCRIRNGSALHMTKRHVAVEIADVGEVDVKVAGGTTSAVLLKAVCLMSDSCIEGQCSPGKHAECLTGSATSAHLGSATGLKNPRSCWWPVLESNWTQERGMAVAPLPLQLAALGRLPEPTYEAQVPDSPPCHHCQPLSSQSKPAGAGPLISPAQAQKHTPLKEMQ